MTHLSQPLALCLLADYKAYSSETSMSLQGAKYSPEDTVPPSTNNPPYFPVLWFLVTGIAACNPGYVLVVECMSPCLIS